METLRTQPTLDSGGAPTNAGGSLTTWIYHPQRGTLSSKRDATNKGASYTYTAAGRLATRTWERGITTTYNERGQSLDFNIIEGRTVGRHWYHFGICSH